MFYSDLGVCLIKAEMIFRLHSFAFSWLREYANGKTIFVCRLEFTLKKRVLFFNGNMFLTSLFANIQPWELGRLYSRATRKTVPIWPPADVLQCFSSRLNPTFAHTIAGFCLHYWISKVESRRNLSNGIISNSLKKWGNRNSWNVPMSSL